MKNGRIIDDNGTKHWYLNGIKHRIDGPAMEDPAGNKWWYQDGDLHRTDGPAIHYVNGEKHWYVKGQRHREDGPAIEYEDGTKEWYLYGQEYRDIIPQYALLNYMKLNNLTLALLLTDPDPVVRKSTDKYKWELIE
jgi:hypothetical protein